MDKTIYVPVVNVHDDVVNVRLDKTIYVPVVNVRDDVVKNGSEAYVVAQRNEWLYSNPRMKHAHLSWLLWVQCASQREFISYLWTKLFMYLL